MSVLSSKICAKYFAVVIRLLNPMLGTVPFSGAVYEGYLAGRKMKHQEKYGNLTPEELEEVESKTVEGLEDSSWTGFHRSIDLPESDPNFNRHFIYNYMIKGNLRYAGQIFNGSTYESKGKEKTFTKNLKSKITNSLFVSPRRIYLPIIEEEDLVPHLDESGEETGIMRLRHSIERPLRADTPQGARTCLARSDYLPAGAELDLQLTLMDIKGTNKVARSEVEALLSYGERNGLGQWRNAGFGSYEVIRFDEVTEEEAHTIAEHGGGVSPMKV